MKDEPRAHPFRDSQQDVTTARQIPDTAQTRDAAYRLAFTDDAFMTREDLRPIRLQLELLKPQLMLDEAGIDSTVVLFGGARIRRDGFGPLSAYYDEARRFARMITERALACGNRDWIIVTGGGPGVMEAGNRGAAEAGGRSIGLNVVLPHEQAPNPYVTPELCFNFHYFAIRKMHFLMRAAAVVVFPGGFGTMDEMFEALTLIQTKRMKPLPFLLFGEAYWRGVINWEALVAHGTISAADLALFQFVESADQALAAIDAWASRRGVE